MKHGRIESISGKISNNFSDQAPDVRDISSSNKIELSFKRILIPIFPFPDFLFATTLSPAFDTIGPIECYVHCISNIFFAAFAHVNFSIVFFIFLSNFKCRPLLSLYAQSIASAKLSVSG